MGDVDRTKAEVADHEQEGNPHPDSAAQSDLSDHADAGNPHPDSAAQSDLSDHADAGNPHPDSASQSDISTDFAKFSGAGSAGTWTQLHSLSITFETSTTNHQTVTVTVTYSDGSTDSFTVGGNAGSHTNTKAGAFFNQSKTPMDVSVSWDDQVNSSTLRILGREA